MLGDLQESLDHLGQGSKNMVAQVRRDNLCGNMTLTITLTKGQETCCSANRERMVWLLRQCRHKHVLYAFHVASCIYDRLVRILIQCRIQLQGDDDDIIHNVHGAISPSSGAPDQRRGR